MSNASVFPRGVNGLSCVDLMRLIFEYGDVC